MSVQEAIKTLEEERFGAYASFMEWFLEPFPVK